jgi:hypothetical protein
MPLTMPEWMKSPRGMALIGAGIGVPVAIAAFYAYKLRQTIVTVTTSRADQVACDPTTDVTVTVTVTDGFGRPRAFEPLHLEAYIDGGLLGKTDVVTSPAGDFRFTIGAKDWCRKSEHIKTDQTATLTITATARNVTGAASITVKFKACEYWKTGTGCPSDYPYGCP